MDSSPQLVANVGPSAIDDRRVWLLDRVRAFLDFEYAMARDEPISIEGFEDTVSHPVGFFLEFGGDAEPLKIFQRGVAERVAEVFPLDGDHEGGARGFSGACIETVERYWLQLVDCLSMWTKESSAGAKGEGPCGARG